jgi:hypothetical protein
VPQTEKLIACANCARPVREKEVEDLGWRYWSDGRDLHLICPLCAHREFDADAPSSSSPGGSRQLGPVSIRRGYFPVSGSGIYWLLAVAAEVDEPSQAAGVGGVSVGARLGELTHSRSDRSPAEAPLDPQSRGWNRIVRVAGWAFAGTWRTAKCCCLV